MVWAAAPAVLLPERRFWQVARNAPVGLGRLLVIDSAYAHRAQMVTSAEQAALLYGEGSVPHRAMLEIEVAIKGVTDEHSQLLDLIRTGWPTRPTIESVTIDGVDYGVKPGAELSFRL